jgi:hypothetical protein
MKALTATLSVLILSLSFILAGCSEHKGMHDTMESDMKAMAPQETTMDTMKKDTTDMNKSSLDSMKDEKMGMDKPMKNHTM